MTPLLCATCGLPIAASDETVHDRKGEHHRSCKESELYVLRVRLQALEQPRRPV